ncbi:MAG: O-succinylhomoserine sulfhydrylase [Rhodobacteraceae bacterium]|nr:O-succinylhomoserine sulfhydrylase [Paracoccaceae bacterium]
MKNLHTRTQLVHAGTRRSQYGELSEAIYLTQGFVYPSAEAAQARFDELGDDEFIYARYGNPTVAMFEDRIAMIEGAEAAFATASGMAAVNGALFALLEAGDHIVAAKALFGSCLFIVDTLLPQYGVEVTLVDGTNLDEWRAAMRPNTKVCFFETLSNPTLEAIDIAGVAAIAHDFGAKVVVDNVFATPIFQRALTLGADVIIYSATKHIDGQGRCLGGVVLGDKDFIRGPLETYLKHTGGALSPFNAWVMLKGLETLDLRVRAQADTALKLSNALENHKKLARTIYPGLKSHPQHELVNRQMEAGGTVFSLEIIGGKAAAFRFINALEIVLISNNLGDAKSIITHPATTTHSRLTAEQLADLGISEGLVRVSVGLEDFGDLLGDIEAALNSG